MLHRKYTHKACTYFINYIHTYDICIAVFGFGYVLDFGLWALWSEHARLVVFLLDLILVVYRFGSMYDMTYFFRCISI